jgi:phosphogluconate dehydratase
LLKQGLLHDDVRTVFGHGLDAYTVEAKLGENRQVIRVPVPEKSGDPRC